MNPGESRPRDSDRDSGLGQAIQDRLAHLAARLERLTGEAMLPAEAVLRPAAVGSARVAPILSAPSRPSSSVEYRTPRSEPVADDAMEVIANALRELTEDGPGADSPADPGPQGPAHSDDDGRPSPEDRLRSIRERIEQLKAKHAPDAPAGDDDLIFGGRIDRRPMAPSPPEPSVPLPPAAEEFTEAFADITAHLRDPGRLREPENPDVPAIDYDAAIAEIAARQRIIDDASAAIDVGARGPVLESDGGAFGRRYDERQPPASGYARPPSPAGAQTGQLASGDLASEVAAMRHEMGAIRALLDSTALSSTLNELRSGYGSIVQRLDRLDRAAAEPGQIETIAQTLLHRMPGVERFDMLAAEIDRLSERVAKSDNRAELSRIEAKITALGAPRPSNPIAFEAPVGEGDLGALHASIQDIHRMLHDSGSPALARVEQRLSRIADLFESSISAAPKADMVSELVGRLERLADQGEAVPAAIETLASEIAGLRDHGRSELAALDNHLVALSGRVDELVGANPSSAAVDRLETMVADLSGRFDSIPQNPEALSTVEANLSRLEALVQDTRERSLTEIHDAAREAVRDLSDLGGPDAAIVEALKSDLNVLQAAASQTTERTAANLDNVHATLDRIVERLSALESETRSERRQAAAPVSEQRDAPIEQTPGAIAAERLRHTPDLNGVGPGRPIEPGGWRPDDGVSERDRKADFIAAARRAAQAAAAEHSRGRSPAADLVEDSEPGLLSKVGEAVTRHRRPLLLAVGAIVLAIAAIQIIKPFAARNDATPIVAEPAPVAVAPVVEAPPPAVAEAAPSAFEPPVGVSARIVGPGAPPAATPPLVAPEPVAELPLVEPMPPEAVGTEQLRLAAAQGNPAALFEVGLRYAEGRGVNRDPAEAARWYERAAERGLAVAQYRLATLFEGGQGVAEDRTAARDWYQLAAEQGNIQAMHNLGVMLSQGVNGSPDFVGAIDWFTAAAEHGVRDSQYNLGVIYARGIGVEPDLVESYRWFALSAAQGDTDAAARRDDVAAALSPDQLAAGRAAVSAWTVTPPAAAGNQVTIPEGGWDAPEQHVQVPAPMFDDQPTPELVRTIQALLASLGYDPGPADGVDGPRTRNAIRAFQATIGNEANGEISPELLMALDVRA